jgi:hypothetical protein
MLTKSQQLLLYLIELKGGTIDDKTKLAKYEYFTDFIHYAFNNTPVSEKSIIYTKQKQGLLARNFTEDLEVLKKSGFIIEHPRYNFSIDKKNYKINLSAQEKRTARFVINRYGNLNFQELVDICHTQEPYLSTTKGAIAEFFTAYNLVDSYPEYEQFED